MTLTLAVAVGAPANEATWLADAEGPLLGEWHVRVVVEVAAAGHAHARHRRAANAAEAGHWPARD